jgi:hypothetical protein
LVEEIFEQAKNQVGLLQEPIPTHDDFYKSVQNRALLAWGRFDPIFPYVSTMTLISHKDYDYFLLYYRILNPFEQENLVLASFSGDEKWSSIFTSLGDLFRENGGASYSLTNLMPTFIMSGLDESEDSTFLYNLFWYSAHYANQDLTKIVDLFREFEGRPLDRITYELEGRAYTRLDTPRAPTRKDYSEWLAIILSGKHLLPEYGYMKELWKDVIESQTSRGNLSSEDMVSAEEAFAYLELLGL